jgi:hypothetical protein
MIRIEESRGRTRPTERDGVVNWLKTNSPLRVNVIEADVVKCV